MSTITDDDKESSNIPWKIIGPLVGIVAVAAISVVGLVIGAAVGALLAWRGLRVWPTLIAAAIGGGVAWFTLGDTGLLTATGTGVGLVTGVGVNVASIAAAVMVASLAAAMVAVLLPRLAGEQWRAKHPTATMKATWAKIRAKNEEEITNIRNAGWEGISYGVAVEPAAWAELGAPEDYLDERITTLEPPLPLVPVIRTRSLPHSIVYGESGFGKTELLKKTAHDAISEDEALLYVDMKGDPAVTAALAGYARKFGVPFYHFTIPTLVGPYEGPSELGWAHWDPIALGKRYNAETRRDCVMDLLPPNPGGDAGAYYSALNAYLTLAMTVDTAVGAANGDRPLSMAPAGSFARVAWYMADAANLKSYWSEGSRLPDVARFLPSGQTVESVTAAIASASVKKLQAGGREGAANNLSAILLGQVGALLNDRGPDRTIDLTRLASRGGIVVLELDSMQYKTESAGLGRMMILDVMNSASSIIQTGRTLRVIVDEFASLGSERVKDIFEKGRSLGVSMVLSCQNMGQVDDLISPKFRESIMANAAEWVTFTGSTMEQARVFSESAGSSDRLVEVARLLNEKGEPIGDPRFEKRRVPNLPTEWLMEHGSQRMAWRLVRVGGGTGQARVQRAERFEVIAAPEVEVEMFTVERGDSLIVEPIVAATAAATVEVSLVDEVFEPAIDLMGESAIEPVVSSLAIEEPIVDDEGLVDVEALLSGLDGVSFDSLGDVAVVVEPAIEEVALEPVVAIEERVEDVVSEPVAIEPTFEDPIVEEDEVNLVTAAPPTPSTPLPSVQVQPVSVLPVDDSDDDDRLFY